MGRRSAGPDDIKRAVAGHRLRVNHIDGLAFSRRPEPKARWRPVNLEEVRGPHQRLAYHRISFSVHGEHFRCLMHRVVWWAAGRCIPEGVEINHKNGVKFDNRLDNLGLMTPGQNLTHSHAAGLHPKPIHTRSLSREQVLEVRRMLRAGDPGVIIATTLGVSANIVNRIKRSHTYRDVR